MLQRDVQHQTRAEVMMTLLQPITNFEYELAFEIYERYMKQVIGEAFGWEDGFQRDGFNANLRPEWFSWVISSGEKVGLVCGRLKDTSLHIHLLIVFEKFQRQGYAASIASALHVKASKQGLDLTLSCLKNNNPAMSLYTGLGFVASSEDEYFYNLIGPKELPQYNLNLCLTLP